MLGSLASSISTTCATSPLDNILMKALREYGFEPLSCTWSGLNDYNIYLDRQRWVRSRFPLSPLDVGFKLWMEQPLTLH